MSEQWYSFWVGHFWKSPDMKGVSPITRHIDPEKEMKFLRSTGAYVCIIDSADLLVYRDRDGRDLFFMVKKGAS